jgi:ACS family D-galactonate transporter-like MFS transporter
MVAPALTGYVLDRTGHFFWAFVIAAAVGLASSASWIFVVGPIEPVQWDGDLRTAARAATQA